MGQEAESIRRERERRTLIVVSIESYHVDGCWPQAHLCEPIDSSEKPGSENVEFLNGLLE